MIWTESVRRLCVRSGAMAAMFVLLVASPCVAMAAGQEAWTVTTTDFESHSVTNLTLDAGGASFHARGAQEVARIDWNQFLLAERDGAASSTAGAPGGQSEETLVLFTRQGDRLPGALVRIADDVMTWKNPSFGEIAYPLASIAGLSRGSADTRQSPAAPGSAAETDAVRLRNGDVVRGVLVGGSAETLDVQTESGEVAVSLASIVEVTLAAPATASAGPQANPAAAEARIFGVRLTDGTRVTAASVELSGDKLKVVPVSNGEAKGQPQEVPTSAVVSVEQINGPVRWLSTLKPSAEEQAPFLGLPWPSRFDHSVSGGPLRVGDRTYARGIGVHARSVLTFPLDGAYQGFRTRYAIDGDPPYANVTVRIRLDDQVVHEQSDVVAGHISPVVTVDIPPAAKTLSLEVDYGQNYDVQDRLNWIEPALLRERAQ